jgi:hypothetical protein
VPGMGSNRTRPLFHGFPPLLLSLFVCEKESKSHSYTHTNSHSLTHTHKTRTHTAKFCEDRQSGLNTTRY